MKHLILQHLSGKIQNLRDIVFKFYPHTMIGILLLIQLLVYAWLLDIAIQDSLMLNVMKMFY